MTGRILGADRGLASDIQLTWWVSEVAELTKPDRIAWCDGSYREWQRLTSLLVEQGTFRRLNPQIRPDSFYCASDPGDVARVEDRTFICSEKQEDAGPMNNWIAPDEMRKTFAGLFNGWHAGPHHVRGPVLHGAAGRRLLPSRCRDHRLTVCGGVDADHDENGDTGAAAHLRTRLVRPRGAFRRRPAAGRARLTCGGRAARPSTFRTSPRPGRSGPTVRGMAATRCSARNATRCGWHR